jgi:hypothetical protein
MKKYLLTIFGEFKSDEICKEIAIALTPVVDSPNLKFQFTKGVLIFHFASEMDMSDIHEYLEMTSYDLYESFILSEYTDKVSVFMTEENKKHLFNLDKNDTNNGIELVLTPKNGIQYMDEDEDDEFVALLLNEVKNHIKTPTLDQLLEKIKNEGVGNLTPFEKGTLDNYSKN